MWVAANMELNMAATEPEQSRTLRLGNFDSADLSEDTFIQFVMWNFSFFQMAQSTDYLYRQGSLDWAI